jgi:hypothetical protein
MARSAAPGDYQVSVEGLGAFTFARRTMRDEFAVAAEYSRLTEGVPTPTDFLHFYARAFATIKVLQVVAPAGWGVENLDPQEDASYAQLIAVFDAVRAQEADFRRKPPA